MAKYNSYHSQVKICYSLGLEKELLPKTFTKDIPRSTYFQWRQTPSDKYLGSEFAHKIDGDLENIKLILDEKLRLLTSAYFSFCRLYIVLINFIGRKKMKMFIKQNRDLVVNLMERLPEFVDKSIFYKFFFLNAISYGQMKAFYQAGCKNSPIGICFQRKPNQVSYKELLELKKMLLRKKYRSWSSSAVWAKAVRLGKVSMSRTTWYHYARMLKLNVTRKTYKAKRKEVSVRATQPNEIWHMDVSQYITADNVKFYIYTVVDNFSRKILAYDYSKKLSAAIRVKSLRRAAEEQFEVNFDKINKTKPSLNLIVDGGSENNNKTVHDFIRNAHIDIDKKIALKDVTYSNNMVENPFKTMKSKYFRGKEIFESTFAQELHHFVQDFNSERPHYAHELYTPDEVHLNPEIKGTRPDLAQARQKRLETNRNYCCKAFKVVA
jgi:transposase InsO family protein